MSLSERKGEVWRFRRNSSLLRNCGVHVPDSTFDDVFYIYGYIHSIFRFLPYLVSTESLSLSIIQYSLQEARLRTGRSVHEQVALSGSPYRTPRLLTTVPHYLPYPTHSPTPSSLLSTHFHCYLRSHTLRESTEKSK